MPIPKRLLSNHRPEPVSKAEDKDYKEYTREAQEESDEGVNEHNDEQSDRKNSKIHKVISQSSPEVLEAGVQSGIQILEGLKGRLIEKSQQSEDAAQWLQQIGKC